MAKTEDEILNEYIDILVGDYHPTPLVLPTGPIKKSLGFYLYLYGVRFTELKEFILDTSLFRLLRKLLRVKK